MTYKGLEIVQQYITYDVWRLDDEGNPQYSITDYESDLDGYQVWGPDWQHDKLVDTYDSLEEVKKAIDDYVSKVPA